MDQPIHSATHFGITEPIDKDRTVQSGAMIALAEHTAHADTFNDLVEQVEQMDTETELRQKEGRTSSQFEQSYRILVENVPDLVYSLNEDGIIIMINKAVNAYGYTVEELIGRFFPNLIYYQDRDRACRVFFEAATQRKNFSRSQQFRVVTKNGEIRWLEANCSIHFTAKGEFIWQEGVCRDITKTIQVQESLIKTQDDLEETVRLRTLELTQANRDLQKEILERRETEHALLEREKDLKAEKANLLEANTALKVLLKRREKDKFVLEERVMYNIKKLVRPYLATLAEEMSNERHETYLRIIETNLNDIASNFSRRLSVEFNGLTASEIKVANFIRQGKRSLEIAELLGLSIRTVEAYRMNIRNKLQIQNKKLNLSTYLMSIK